MAEEYKADNKPVAGTERTTVTTTTTRQGAENGAKEYPIPERKGFPWWLLLPLLLIPLFFLFRSGGRTEDTPTAVPVAATSPSPTTSESPVVASGDSTGVEAAGIGTAASSEQSPEGKDIKVFKGEDITVAPKAGASVKGEPLTDVFAITGAKDQITLVGRKVQLKNVNVTRVLSDQAFYVGTDSSAEMLVLLDPRLDAGTNGGEKVVIAEGQTVSLTGLLETAPTAETMSKYKVSTQNADGVDQQGVYLHATIAQDKS